MTHSGVNETSDVTEVFIPASASVIVGGGGGFFAASVSALR
jgi:hypothetical protein